MRYDLLPAAGRFYKANLHTHSTVSDGQSTPAELKKLYKDHGYSVLALTDHELLVDHSDLTDSDFVMITGMEYAVCELPPEDYNKSKTIEFNFLARDPHNVTQVCFDPTTVWHGETWRAKTARLSSEGVVQKVYTREFFQHVIDEANRNGFLVSLNHPTTSMETSRMFASFTGLFSLEIYNYGSNVLLGISEYNPQLWDIMLRAGRMVQPLATDDCHQSRRAEDDPYCDRFGGWTMIKTEKLDYPSVIAALENRQFYASNGPEIKELYVEDNKVHLRCSKAKRIIMKTAYRFAAVPVNAKPGAYVEEAVFPLPDPENAYMHFDVVDEFGRHANSCVYVPKDYRD